jgi:hypothetical protein
MDDAYIIWYSNNGTVWNQFGTGHGKVSKVLRTLYNIHTAYFYRIMDVVYQLNGSTKTYDRI